MKIASFLLLIIASIFLNGCFSWGPDGWGAKPPAGSVFNKYPRVDKAKYKDYSDGFNDGCSTFYSIVGVGVARLHSVKVDGWKLTNKNPKTGQSPHPDLGSEPGLYATGFGDGMEHCTYNIDWNIL
jgi:hypothetical protein